MRRSLTSWLRKAHAAASRAAAALPPGADVASDLADIEALRSSLWQLVYRLDADLHPTVAGGEYLDPTGAASAAAAVAAQGR